MYGYEMIENLRLRSNDVFDLKAGTLYPLLHGLEEKGYLTSYEQAAAGKLRKYYSLTKSGRRFLTQKQEEWRQYSAPWSRCWEREVWVLQEYKKAYLQGGDGSDPQSPGKRLAEEELCGHIEDQTEAYIRDGMTPEAAEAEAVRQMGDPVSVGLELDHLYRPKPDWKLMALTVVLLLLGLLVQYGVSGSSAWFTRQLIETQIGIAVMVAAYFVDYTVVGKHSLWMWGGLTVLIGAEIVSQGMLFGSFRNGQYFVYPLLMLFVPLLPVFCTEIWGRWRRPAL